VKAPTSALDAPAIASRIVLVRGRKVILSSDLAALYGVEPRRLNEQVRRNRERFPSDFVFPLTNQEVAILKSQIATSSWGGRRKPPLAFTEHGAVMAANIVNSRRAIEMSVFVVRAFVRLREGLAANEALARRIADLERRLEQGLATHDRAIREILEAVRVLMAPPDQPPKRPIGFVRAE
jgi:hypothetical protein